MVPLERLLSEALAAQLPELLPALRRAYRDACDARAQFAGANEVTFGTEVYHFAKYEIGKVAERTKLVTILDDEEPKFRFGAGKYVLACHKVGRRADDDIHASFPRARGATSMVEEQMMLPGVLVAMDRKAVKAASRVVLAHMGNHEEGLCAVYLCIAAGGAEDEKIRGWAHAERIWKRDPAELAATEAPKTQTPPVEPEAEVDAQPRRRVRRKSGEEV